jgi:hypothetical protein
LQDIYEQMSGNGRIIDESRTVTQTDLTAMVGNTPIHIIQVLKIQRVA